jgi:hypothetical protein
MGAYEYQAPGIPGDLDGDGDVTLADLGLWLDCLKGPGQPVPSGGLAADIDGDADVDLLDFALFCGLVSE